MFITQGTRDTYHQSATFCFYITNKHLRAPDQKSASYAYLKNYLDGKILSSWNQIPS